jgi:transcriptional regulator with XRE-family HTH domain
MTANTPNIIIGQNIKLLREGLGLTQEALAQYLNTAREQIAYYESGTRSVPTTQLSKLADLFCMNEYDFYEEDTEKRKVNIAFAFRADNIESQDLESIARFKKIVRNYLNMQKVLGHE